MMIKLQGLNLLYGKERHFTSPLLQACGIAFLCHLLFFLLFQVVPLKLRLNEITYPPIQVDAQSDFNPINLHIDFKAPLAPISKLPKRPIVLPTLKLSSADVLTSHMEDEKNILALTGFQTTEEEIYLPTVKMSKNLPLSPLQVYIAGPIAEYYELQGEVTFDNAISTHEHQKEQRAIFRVMIKKQTGKIFWYEPIEPSKSDSFNRFAEKCILDLHFSKRSDALNVNEITDGIIEIHIRV